MKSGPARWMSLIASSAAVIVLAIMAGVSPAAEEPGKAASAPQVKAGCPALTRIRFYPRKGFAQRMVRVSRPRV